MYMYTYIYMCVYVCVCVYVYVCIFVYIYKICSKKLFCIVFSVYSVI